MLEGKGLSRQCLHRNDNNKVKSFSKWKVCFGSHIRPLSPAWRWFCLMKIWFKKKKNVDQDKTIFIVLAFKTIQLRKKKKKNTAAPLCFPPAPVFEKETCHTDARWHISALPYCLFHSERDPSSVSRGPRWQEGIVRGIAIDPNAYAYIWQSQLDRSPN